MFSYMRELKGDARETLQQCRVVPGDKLVGGWYQDSIGERRSLGEATGAEKNSCGPLISQEHLRHLNRERMRVMP